MENRQSLTSTSAEESEEEREKIGKYSDFASRRETKKIVPLSLTTKKKLMRELGREMGV